MFFPLMLSGKVLLHGLKSGGDTSAFVEARLAKNGATNIRHANGELTFDVPWTVSHGPLQYIDKGSLRLSAEGAEPLTYRLSMRRAILHVVFLLYGLGGGLFMHNQALGRRLLLPSIGLLVFLTYWRVRIPRAMARFLSCAVREQG
jgi:hypothetical protein